MRSKFKLASLVGVLALALSVIGGAGVAQAVKVTEDAPGGPVPDATGGGALATSEGLLTREFDVGGKKLNKKQIFDVRLEMTGFGSVAGANGDLRVVLVGPRGEKAFVPVPGRTSFGLEYSDRSRNTRFCNPFETVALDCLYATGVIPGIPGSGGFFGQIDAVNFNSVFRGKNPKGDWTLQVYDTSPGGTTTLGESTLSIKAVNRFVKERGK